MYWLCVIFIYYRALDIRTKAYGPDHLDVGQTLLTYSAYLLSVDASKSADAAIKAVEIFEVYNNLTGNYYIKVWNTEHTRPFVNALHSIHYLFIYLFIYLLVFFMSSLFHYSRNHWGQNTLTR